MQDLKVIGVRAAWVHFPVESTESIEFKANYEKTRMTPFLTISETYVKHRPPDLAVM